MLNVAAYHFVAIDNPRALAGRLRAAATAAQLLGTVIVATEGLNCFLAGPDGALHAWMEDLMADPRFAPMQVKYSESGREPFRKLLVKVKPEIISFRRFGIEPGKARAPAVAPAKLAQWLAQGRDDAGRELVLVDTRNAQEVAHGTFERALTLPIARFTELPEALEAHREALKGKTVVTFCTGGIRCEKAALWMQNAGYDNVFQLQGGILNYFEQVGGQAYSGACFVFDERVALDPQLRPVAAD
jgi:UPF0176 protein